MNSNKAFILVLFGLLFNIRANSQTFSVSPGSAEPYTQLTVTITGQGTKFGQGSSCISPSCTDLGSSLYFFSGSSSLSVQYNAISFPNDTTAQVSFITPGNGYYRLATPNGITISNYFNLYAAPKPVPSVSISPAEGEAGSHLTVTVTGTNTRLGLSGSCSDPGCKDLGSGFYFNQGSQSLSQFLPFTSSSLLDTSHAEVSFVLPQQSGNYFLATENGFNINNSFSIYPKQQPTVSISPAGGIENTSLSVTITGNGVKIGQGTSCISGECIDLGDHLIFNAGSTTLNVPYQSLNFQNETTATATITLPAAGYYDLITASGFKLNNSMNVSPKPVPSIYINPAAGEAGSVLTVTITGSNTVFGQGAACSANPNCTDLGTSFFSQGSPTSFYLPFLSQDIVDSAQAIVSFKLPEQSGSYSLYTTNGLRVSNQLYVNPKQQPTITISPSEGIEKTSLQVTITGNDLVFAQASNCSSLSNCRDLGQELYFTSGSSTLSVPLSNIVYLNNQIATATITLPLSGVYAVKTATGINARGYFYVSPKPGPALSISANSGIEGTTLKVTITGTNVTLGKGNKCVQPDCINLGSEIQFFGQGSPTTSGTLPLKNVKLLNTNQAEVNITLPKSGTYRLMTNGIYFSEYLYVSPKPAPYFEISPSSGVEGTQLKVTITGTNMNLGKGSACDADPNCTNIGTAFQYFGQDSSSVSGTLPFSKIKIIDKQHADVTIQLPVAGLYYLRLSNGLYAGNYLSVSPKPAPSFTFSPNTVEEGTKLTVTITGTSTQFGKGSNCVLNPACTDLGSEFYFTKQSSPSVSGTIPFSNVQIISNTEAKVTFMAPSPGEYTIWAANNLYSFTRLFVSEQGSSTPVLLGIETENTEDNIIKVYPNPTQGTVSVNEGCNSILYNSYGEKVFSTSNSNFDISALPQGIYLMKVTDSKGKTSKVTLKKE